jgi:MFS family permease
MAAATMVMSPLSGRIVGTRGSRLPLVVSGAAIAISCAMLAHIDATTPFTWLFGAYLIFGVGFGLVNAPITNAAVSGMPRSQAGVASALASTSRQVGATLGVAIGGSIAGGAAALGPAFAIATHPFWWIVVGCGVAIVALGLLSTGELARASVARVAGLLDPKEAPCPDGT